MIRTRLRKNRMYQVAVSVARTMLSCHLINLDEYVLIDIIFLKLYKPYIGYLLSDNARFVPYAEMCVDMQDGGRIVENR